MVNVRVEMPRTSCHYYLLGNIVLLEPPRLLV